MKWKRPGGIFPSYIILFNLTHKIIGCCWALGFKDFWKKWKESSIQEVQWVQTQTYRKTREVFLNYWPLSQTMKRIRYHINHIKLSYNWIRSHFEGSFWMLQNVDHWNTVLSILLSWELFEFGRSDLTTLKVQQFSMITALCDLDKDYIVAGV